MAPAQRASLTAAAEALELSLRHAGPVERSAQYWWQITLSFDNGQSVKDCIDAIARIRGDEPAKGRVA